MNWRNALLSGVLAAGLMMTFVPRAAADPPPWAGRWHNNKHYDGKHDKDWRHHWDHDHDRWDHRHRDWRYGRDDDAWRWRRWHRNDRYDRYDNPRGYGYPNYGSYGRPYSGSYRYGNDGQYGKLMDRMRNDQAKIAEIEPTGRHRKALQWYKDDLRNAQRDMDNYGRASR